MRKTINPQPNPREPWLELEHARELETISSLLDAHPKLNELVLQDLRSVTPPAGERCWSWGNERGAGSPGVVGEAAESVHRYRELAFHLADSRSYRTFCQLGIIEPTPSKSTLAANIKAVKFETLEQINRELVSVAERCWDRKGKKSTSGLHGSGIKHSSAYRLRAAALQPCRLYRRDEDAGNRRPRRGPHLHQLRRTAQSKHADEDAAVYAAHKCLL